MINLKKKYIDIFMEKLHIDWQMQTDPEKFKIALKNMYLDDFRYSNDLYSKYLNKPVNLFELFSTINNAIIEKHPAIVEFLCQALEKNLITDTIKFLPQVETTIYNIIILELITEKMYNDLSFMIEIQEHYFSKREIFLNKKRNSIGYYLDLNNTLGGLFEVLKTITVDYTFSQYIEFREKKQLSKNDLIKKTLGLSLNIFEALVKDFSENAYSNSKIAYKLFINPIKEIYLIDDNKKLKQIFKKGWAPLYETWNLAFITRNLNYLNFLYPKLLIPSVVNANEEDYLINRGMSLWIMLSVYFLKKINKDADTSKLNNSKKLSDLWGEINLNYAKKINF